MEYCVNQFRAREMLPQGQALFALHESETISSINIRDNLAFKTTHSIDLARNSNSGCANEILGCANATFDENERIRVILGCAIGLIACAKHRCVGGWLKL